MKKVHRVIKLNQNSWLKPYIEINTKLRQKAKEKNFFFEKDFFKLMKKLFQSIGNVRKHRHVKLVTRERRKTKLSELVSEPNYHTTKFFTENL